MADTRQRRPQVAFHVVREGLEGGDVEHPAAATGLRRRLVEQAVERPQEGGQRLPRPGGGVYQSVLTGGYGGPALLLSRRGRAEGRLEPCPGGGREGVQHGTKGRRRRRQGARRGGMPCRDAGSFAPWHGSSSSMSTRPCSTWRHWMKGSAGCSVMSPRARSGSPRCSTPPSP